MKLTRILSISLAVLMIVALVGCGGSKRQPIELTLSTEDSAAILNAAGIRLPDASEAAGAGTTVKWCAHYDPFQNYSEDEIVNTGFYTFKEKYGGSLEHVEVEFGERWNELSRLLLSNNAPDLFPGETAIFPNYVMKGMFAPVNNYIDFDDPLWAEMKDYAYTYFGLAGNVYAAVISADYGHVVPYNRRVINEWGFDDPAELYANDQWTWDKFYEMCLDFSDPDEDRYALDGWYFSASFYDSVGQSLVPLDTETGKFYSNLDYPGFERAAQYLYDLNKNDCTYPWWNSWSCRDNSANGAGVKDGKCLFWIVAPWGFTDTLANNALTWGDISTEFMFVPLPRDPQGDGKYYITSSPLAYCIINGAENPEGAALIITCERFKALDPVVKAIDEKQLRETYGWTDEMIEMNKICFDLANTGSPIVNYNDGYGNYLNEIVGNDGKIAASGHPTSRDAGMSWAQLKETYKDRVGVLVDELNADIEKFIANGGAVDRDSLAAGVAEEGEATE